MNILYQRLRELRLPTLAALTVLAVGFFSNLFWQPAPNRVVVPVLENSEQTVVQLYYRYGWPGPRSFFEYYSQKELLHPSDHPLEVSFTLPGWERLRAIRLDLGSEARDYRLGPLVFGYQSLLGFEPVFHLDAVSVLDRWQPNDQVAEAKAVGGDLLVEVSGTDPYLVIPVSREDWRGSLPTDTLWWLRLIRFAHFALLAGMILAVGRLLRSGWLNRAGSPETPRWNRFWWIAVLMGMFAMGFWVYKPYLLFQKLYLFKDVATDSADVFWPVFMHIAHLFRADGYPLWSFSVGSGQGIFNWIGDPFLFLIYALPPVAIGFALGWLQLLKSLVAGMLFLGWLRLLGIGRFAATVTAVGLMFSAHMVIRGNWTHYATEVVMVAFALFAFECFLRKRIWQLLPLAILFLVVRGVYHTYVWSILFLSYALLRMWLEAGWQPRWTGKKLVQLAGCYLLGIGLAAVFLFPNLAEILTSPRVTGSESTITSFAHSTLWRINEPEEWLSSLYGLFAPDLLGRGSFYSGWRNYLEGPHLYVGTLAVLLLPQAFLGRGRRLRVVLALSLLAVLLYLFVPYARYALNAFSGVYYKTSSFWVSLVIAGTAALALDNLIRRRILSRWLLLVTLVVCLVAMSLLLRSEFILEWLRVKESYRVYRQVIFLLFGYSLILVFLKSDRLRGGGLLLLLLLPGWEVAQFAGGSSRDRLSLRGDIVETGGFYFDDSYAAVRMIEEGDDGFYRIEKGNVSVHLNDSLGQNYRGLSSYYSFNSGGYLTFLGPEGFDVDYLIPGHGSSYVRGPGERTILATLLSTKYFITRDWGNPQVPPGYAPWGRAGDAAIYRNTCFVPLGAVYFQTVREDTVRGFPPATRDLVALAAAIIPGETAGIEANFSIPELTADHLAGLEKLAGSPGGAEWLNFYEEQAAQLAEVAVEWSSIGEKRLSGFIHLERPGVVYLSIPDNKGWRAEVNGEATAFVPVHFGFRGLILPAGEHFIELSYFPPWMKLGIAVSLCSLVILIAGSLAFRRKATAGQESGAG